MNKKPKIFVCYSSKDKPFVRELVERLAKDGIDTWFDELEIRIGESIHQKVEDGLTQSDFFAVVLSKSSVQSKWVQNELSSAANIERLAGAGVFILPILLDDCDVPPLLLDRRYANFKDDPESAYSELIDAIYHHFKKRYPVVDLDRIAPQEITKDLVQRMAENRQLIYQLSPRQFERLVASVFHDLGYAVEVTAATKDGGQDLIVVRDIAPGIKPQRYLIDCKRYTKPVGVQMIYWLAQVVAQSNVDRGIIVTTSSFTKGAQEAATKLRVDLVDYQALLEWLKAKVAKEDVGNTENPDSN